MLREERPLLEICRIRFANHDDDRPSNLESDQTISAVLLVLVVASDREQRDANTVSTPSGLI